MAVTPIEKLLEEIEAYPEELRRAIEKKLKAEFLVAKLEQESSDEKDRLAHSDEENDTPSNERIAMFKLDLEIDKLQLRYEQKKGQLEMEYRRNPPSGDKVTEATVSAHIKSNEELVNLREEILQKEYERNITRTTSNSSSPLALRRRKKEKTSEELERLHREWQTAQETLNYAEANIQVLQGKQVTYALLILANWTHVQK